MNERLTCNIAHTVVAFLISSLQFPLKKPYKTEYQYVGLLRGIAIHRGHDNDTH